MKQAGGFIKWAGSDTVGTIRSIPGPELKAGFGIDRPSHYALPVGYIIGFISWLAVCNRIAGTLDGTFLAFQAKVPDAEFNGLVGN